MGKENVMVAAAPKGAACVTDRRCPAGRHCILEILRSKPTAQDRAARLELELFVQNFMRF